MDKLNEIIEELRGWAECYWTTGHEADIFGLCDELEEVRDNFEKQRKQHYEDLLNKALRSGTLRQVIPCKECMFFQQTELAGNGLGVCVPADEPRSPDFFCAIARRKEGTA